MERDDTTDGEKESTALLRAVEYVRMSTDHQQYSTENQATKIREYAEQRGIQIVRSYADAGKSGLNIGGRVSLQQLIADVESGSADFTIILVYDVSRWGRFQDADESAYYEYRCRRAGMQVIYCAEQFENDGSPVATIVKGVKRAMASEYSRELSTKVFAGQCRLIELGFRQGGPAGYGLRRMLIDQNGAHKAELSRGEHKSLQTDRVILMPGPDNEVQIVNQMYKWFIDDGLVESEIAARLNSMQVQTDLDREWTRGTVHEVLTNEKYIGNNVYNRISFKLKKLRVENTPDMWIKKEGAFESIVPPGVFYTAQGISRARAYRYSNEELIERLRNLYQNRGFMSGLIIDETEGMPSTSIYSHRFGSLVRAYQMVGFTPDRDYRYLETNKFLRRFHPEIVKQTESQIAMLGGSVRRDPATDLLLINDEFSISIVLARCQVPESGRHHWKVRFDSLTRWLSSRQSSRRHRWISDQKSFRTEGRSAASVGDTMFFNNMEDFGPLGPCPSRMLARNRVRRPAGLPLACSFVLAGTNGQTVAPFLLNHAFGWWGAIPREPLPFCRAGKKILPLLTPARTARSATNSIPNCGIEPGSAIRARCNALALMASIRNLCRARPNSAHAACSTYISGSLGEPSILKNHA